MPDLFCGCPHRAPRDIVIKRKIYSKRALIMEFNEKLQKLRKQKGLTQEELAEALFVSRTAISKWESGRGYPNIDSLKAIAKFFNITVDELLSGEEILTAASDEVRQKEQRVRDMVFGLIDCGSAILFFLPFFGEKIEGVISEVSLLALCGVSVWMKAAYTVAVALLVLCGILTLALQNVQDCFWAKIKSTLSIAINAVSVLLFIAGLQPYASVCLLIFLAIKVIILIKKR